MIISSSEFKVFYLRMICFTMGYLCKFKLAQWLILAIWRELKWRSDGTQYNMHIWALSVARSVTRRRVRCRFQEELALSAPSNGWAFNFPHDLAVCSKQQRARVLGMQNGGIRLRARIQEGLLELYGRLKRVRPHNQASKRTRKRPALIWPVASPRHCWN